LVPWVRSENIQFGVTECRGVLGYWSVGVLDLVELDLLFYDFHKAGIKIDHHPLLIANIPLLHYSITPWVLKGQDHPSVARSKPGSLGFN